MAGLHSFLFLFVAIAIATGVAAVGRTSAAPIHLPPQHAPFDLKTDIGLANTLVHERKEAERNAAPDNAEPFEEIGQASWYGRWHHGRRTASGETFDMNKLTAAHRSLPLGTNVRVTNLGNGRFIDVTINDRGPYVGARVIDLSRQAARELRMEREGLATVLIEELPEDGAVASGRTRAGGGCGELSYSWRGAVGETGVCTTPRTVSR